MSQLPATSFQLPARGRARLLALVVAVALVVTACGDDDPGTVRLVTHGDFAVSSDVLEAFTAQTGITVEVLDGGSAGVIVNQAVLSAGNPVADVLFGVDNVLLSRPLAADVFVPYTSPNLDAVSPGLIIDPQHRVTPIDYGDVCINYDLLAFEETPPPSSLLDLVEPEYRGMTVVQDPTLSSPGLAFMLATIATFGEAGAYTWLDYWADLRANDVVVVSSWSTAYFDRFSGARAGGDLPIVVSYASSPAAEVVFAEDPDTVASTASLTQGCFRQIEFAGILRGTGNLEGAQQLIDFMLTLTFQEDIPENMFVYPARPDTTLHPAFGTPPDPAGSTLDPDTIEANRDRWLAEWVEVVLR
jgi:thiamine transport system substrate-binding protein